MNYGQNDKLKNLNASVLRLIRENNEAAMVPQTAAGALVLQLRKIIADGYVFYFKAHSFHWNVEGANFPQYHDFFGKVYEQVFGNLDTIAEEMRALRAYAPISLAALIATANIKETPYVPAPEMMFTILAEDNNTIITGLTAGYKLAEAANEVGLSNLLQDLIDKHKKLGWMITSIVKGE